MTRNNRRLGSRGLFIAIGLAFAGCQPAQEQANSPARSAVVAEPSPVDRLATADSSTQVATPSDRRRQRPVDQFRLARADRLAGRFDRAAESLRELARNPEWFSRANIELAWIDATGGDLPAALNKMDAISRDDPFFVIAIAESAQMAYQAERFDESLDRFLQFAQRVPTSARAHRCLAFLLNRMGRRHEAARHVRVLCKLGDVRQDELYSLLSIADAMYDPPPETAAESLGKSDAGDGHDPASPGRRYFPIGPGGVARHHFTQNDYAKAIEVLSAARSQTPLPDALEAFYGRCLAENQRMDELATWLQDADSALQSHADFWAALGTYHLGQNEIQQAVAPLAEAIRRDPTDGRMVFRMHRVMKAMNLPDQAERWQERIDHLRNATVGGNRFHEAIAKSETPEKLAQGPSREVLDSLDLLTVNLDRLSRPLEAILWRAVSLAYPLHSPMSIDQLNERRIELVASGRSFPDDQVRLCQLDLAKFPSVDMNALGTLAVRELDSAPKPRQDDDVPPRFVDEAQHAGLKHTFEVASMWHDSHFRIYQSIGGGVACLDYDLDGRCDLYLAQGAADSPSFVGDQTNQLFRLTTSPVDPNWLYRDVTQLSGASEYRYSTGVTAGDVNQDGFPDLVVANLGQNTLLINNGDGTFGRQGTDTLDDRDLMSTSVAIADLNSDGLPEIYEQNYLDDPNLIAPPKTNDEGVLQVVAPTDYVAANDRIHYARPDGRRDSVTLGDAHARATGLAVLITNFDDQPGNEIYAANDILPNQFWRLDSESAAGQKSTGPNWIDTAAILGASVGADGTPTASMGIAVADYDRSGTLDMMITNFANAPSRLFMGDGFGFRERAMQWQIASASRVELGFGTQAIDYDNDGRSDILVTNGHVENFPIKSAPYEQPPHFFVHRGDHFERFDFSKISDADVAFDGAPDYMSSRHVGRAVAKLDYNQDGRVDAVVTHLNRPTALLKNATSTTHHFVQFQLVGTAVERDAIGARVRVIQNGSVQTQWVTAGDGFLCRNEPLLTFGLGPSETIDRLEIIWPDGQSQSVDNIRVDQRYLIVQSQRPFELHRQI